LQELRGARSIGGASGVAAREDEDVAFGVDGDAGDFAEMYVWRKLQKIGDGVVGEFGRLLSEERSGCEQAQK
jgi:hypothetical protein